MKVMAHVGCQLPIRRMRGAFQPDDPLVELGGVLLHISEKVQFCHCRAKEQDLLGTHKPRDDVVKEMGLVIGMIPSSCLHVLGMTVDMVFGRLNGRLVEIRFRDVKDSCFVVVDPHRQLMHWVLSNMMTIEP